MSAGGMGHTILVVEDDVALRMLCRVNLELDGYRVVEAPTIADAWRLLREEPVAGMLLDLRVGDEDGRDFLRQLRSTGMAPPVALFTGSVVLTDADRASADGVLTKPFQLDDLASTVAALVDLHTQLDSSL